MRQNRHYHFDMSYLKVFGVQTRVGVDVLKFFGVGAGAGVLKRRAGVESEKCDSAHLWSEAENSFKTTHFALTTCYWKDSTIHTKAMTTVAIPERNMMNKDVKKPRSSLWFSSAKGPTLKKTVGPVTCATHSASIKSVTLHRLLGVARGPIGSKQSNRLKAGPDPTCS